MDEENGVHEAGKDAEVKQTDEESAGRMAEEIGRLQEELNALRKEKAESAEREKGLARLLSLTGAGENELYAEAVKRAEESEELRALPLEKRYEMSCYLILGERAAKREGEISDRARRLPVFAESGGSGEAPAAYQKPPTDFRTARENAKKYFGV